MTTTFDVFSRWVELDAGLRDLGVSEDSRLALWETWQGGLPQHAGCIDHGAWLWARPGAWLRAEDGERLEVGWPEPSTWREPAMVPVRPRGGYAWTPRQMARTEPQWWGTATETSEQGRRRDDQEAVEALLQALPAVWAAPEGWRRLGWMQAAPGWVERLWPQAEPRVRALLAQQRPRWPALVFARQRHALVVLMAHEVDAHGARLVEPSRRGLAEVQGELAEGRALDGATQAMWTWFGRNP